MRNERLCLGGLGSLDRRSVPSGTQPPRLWFMSWLLRDHADPLPHYSYESPGFQSIPSHAVNDHQASNKSSSVSFYQREQHCEVKGYGSANSKLSLVTEQHWIWENVLGNNPSGFIVLLNIKQDCLFSTEVANAQFVGTTVILTFKTLVDFHTFQLNIITSYLKAVNIDTQTNNEKASELPIFLNLETSCRRWMFGLFTPFPKPKRKKKTCALLFDSRFAPYQAWVYVNLLNWMKNICTLHPAG